MSARRAAAVVAALALAGGLPAQLHGEVRWRLPAAGVAFGDAFEFVLEWHWPAAATPAAPAIDAWGPLACRLLGREALPDGQGERRRYHAVAWGAGALELPPLVLRATTADGREGTAACRVPPLVVAPRLDAADTAIEWPDLFAPRPQRGGAWWLVAVLAGVCGGGLWWRRRRAAAVVPQPAPSPAVVALAALARLEPPAAAAPAPRVEAFYRDLAAIVGGHAGRALPVAAATRTSEELVAAAPAGAAPLRACLQRCDAVKFAAARPDPAAHAAAHAAAVQFVQTEGS